MTRFGSKGLELIQELDRTDADQLPPYNAELVRQVLEDVHEHQKYLLDILRNLREKGIEWSKAPTENAVAVLIHHESLLRNKRCMLAYVNARMQRILALRWQLGAVLPPEVLQKLSTHEQQAFKAYSDDLATYMSDIGIDLTVDEAPPKDPFVEVRVLKHGGHLYIDDKTMHLDQHCLQLVHRSEVEPLILQGVVEPFKD